MDTFIRVVITGIGATVCMDIWAFIQRRLLGLPSLDYALVGRWFLWMFRGRYAHQTIVNAPAVRREKSVGWAAHYLTGVGFAFIPIVLVGSEWFSTPSLEIGLLAGLLSLSAPFFIMQPAFGFGLAASKTPAPVKSRLLSIIAHLSFGLGLYLTAEAVNTLLS